MKIFKLLLLVCISLFISTAFAESNTTKKTDDLNLAIPEKDLQNTDSSSNNLNSTKTEDNKSKYCADLLKQVNDLHGTFKPVSRDVLVKRHENDCIMQK